MANYLVWRITMNRASSLSEKYRDFFVDYRKVRNEVAAIEWMDWSSGL